MIDSQILDASRVHGARQIADTYLLALAVTHGGRLVTFGGGIALAAVKGATRENLETLD